MHTCNNRDCGRREGAEGPRGGKAPFIRNPYCWLWVLVFVWVWLGSRFLHAAWRRRGILRGRLAGVHLERPRVVFLVWISWYFLVFSVLISWYLLGFLGFLGLVGCEFLVFIGVSWF